MSTSRAKPNKTTQGDGYVKVSLIDDVGVRRTCSVVMLVAQAFVVPPNLRSTEVIMLDGDLSNVAASNLAWRTPRQAWLYRRQMLTDPFPQWQSFRVRNVNTGEVYNNVVHCGIIEGLLFHEIMESVLGEMCRPPEKRPVYPHGHTYQIV